MNVNPRDGLELAVEQVREDAPGEMTPENHPLSFAGIGELLDQREQGEAAEPAA